MSTTSLSRRSFRRPLSFVAALVVVVLAASACETNQDDFSQRANQVGASRAQVAVQQLSPDTSMSGRADSWARTMRDDWVRAGCPMTDLRGRGILRHSNLGTQYGDIPGWRKLGENIGWSPLTGSRAATLDALHRAYLASPSHRATMLDGAYDRVGIAVVWGPTSSQKASGLCPGVAEGSAAFSTDAFGDF